MRKRQATGMVSGRAGNGNFRFLRVRLLCAVPPDAGIACRLVDCPLDDCVDAGVDDLPDIPAIARVSEPRGKGIR
jgi:hypothetical protein